jgi:hypothetical protein
MRTGSPGSRETYAIYIGLLDLVWSSLVNLARLS